MSLPDEKAEENERPTSPNLLNRVFSHLSTISGRIYSVAEDEASIDEDFGWGGMPEVKVMEAAQAENTHVERKLGLTWNHLTVKGLAADASYNENVISQFIPEKLKRGSGAAKASLKTIIDDSHGCVKPGEMLVVLGRPGAGCTTLLKVLANRRKGYKEIEGQISYGSLDHNEAAKYRWQIVMNTEEETFFPTLTTGQTLDFATRMKVPYKVPTGTVPAMRLESQLRSFSSNY